MLVWKRRRSPQQGDQQHPGGDTARGAGQGREQEPPDSEGHVSTCAEPRCAHSSSRLLRCIEVDGKPTRVSNRNTATAPLSATEWFVQLAPFNGDASLFPFPPQRGCFASVCDYPAWTKSTLLTLPNGTAREAPGRVALKLLSLHELTSGVRRKPLTKARYAGYAGIQKGGPRCDDLAAKASSSVPGTLDNKRRKLGS